MGRSVKEGGREQSHWESNALRRWWGILSMAMMGGEIILSGINIRAKLRGAEYLHLPRTASESVSSSGCKSRQHRRSQEGEQEEYRVKGGGRQVEWVLWAVQGHELYSEWVDHLVMCLKHYLDVQDSAGEASKRVKQDPSQRRWYLSGTSNSRSLKWFRKHFEMNPK